MMLSNLAYAILVLVVVPLLLILLATKLGDKPEMVIEPTNIAAQTCRLHTLPSPCDGKCTRQDSRSYT